MDRFIRGVREISRVAGVAAAFMIGLAVLVICDMVVERYIFGRTTIWQIDVVTYAIVGATFIGSAYVLMYRGHVNVDILPLWLPPRGRYWLAVFTTLVSFAFCLTLLVVTSRYWYEAYSQNWRSNTVWRARLWIPYLSMPAGVGLLVLQYLAEFLALVTGREPPFGITDRRKAA
ncbi:MAG TPA: TRAP transporter small permease [Usitatibacter sp.]|nr:TRAP transporter small permease [Usitatibacter sp.]